MLKTVSSITNSIGALNYKGTWNASTNSPTLASGVGTKGDYYVVSVAGSTTLDGISNWGVGDWAAYNGSAWQRVEGGANLNGVDLSVSGTSTLSGLTASTALALNASKEIVSVTNTGTGDNVLATSPTLVTPNIGVATATQIQNSNGTAGAPAYTFAGDTDNGLYKPATNELGISTAGVERLRFLGAGTILSGTTDDGFFGGSGIGIGFYSTSGFIAASRSGAPSAIFNRFTSEGDLVQFRYAGNAVGSVSVTASATAYNTSSDYRLKENVQPMVGALDKIATLKPCTYTWKSTGALGQGFIAHELQAVFPDAVTGEKDGMTTENYVINPAIPATFDEGGNQLTEAVPAVMGERIVPAYQGIDTSFLVAMLTSAIQELKSQLNEVKSELQTLKGN
jgi:hypothetical protein